MLIHAVEPRERALTVRWSDGTSSDFPYQFLRDNCPSGFHPQTRERVFDLLTVAEDLAPASVGLDGQTVCIDWNETPAHRTELAAAWLAERRPGRRRVDPADIPAFTWDAKTASELPRVKAADLQQAGAFRDWLIATKRSGLSVVTGIADREGAGIEFGERIGFLRRTNFGLTFRVETKPDPNNLAYTAHALALHTDLPNHELPPGFQFLHCVRNEAQGGASVFADGFHIAERLRARNPSAFALLCSIPIPYRFHDRDDDIRVHRPLIGLDERGQVFDVRYSAHLMDAFDMDTATLVDYYHAFRLFMTETRDPTNVVTFRLNSGEMVVFDNRRVLHGRTAFDPSTGHRLLSGFYVDRSEFDSRIRVLETGCGAALG